jgi:hypothetical protein
VSPALTVKFTGAAALPAVRWRLSHRRPAGHEQHHDEQADRLKPT